MRLSELMTSVHPAGCTAKECWPEIGSRWKTCMENKGRTEKDGKIDDEYYGESKKWRAMVNYWPYAKLVTKVHLQPLEDQVYGMMILIISFILERLKFSICYPAEVMSAENVNRPRA